MDTETMISELRAVAEKHKNDRLNTFDTNWYALCTDVANRLEELLRQNKISKMKDKLDCDILQNKMSEINLDVMRRLMKTK